MEKPHKRLFFWEDALKILFAMISLTLAAVSIAEAGQYNSQSARQDREYKSLSAATQRAYGTSSTPTSTYKPPTNTYNSNKRN